MRAPSGAEDVFIQSISWDCQEGTARVVAGPDSDGLTVTVRTTEYGARQAQLSDERAAGHRVYTTQMAENEDYLGVTALFVVGRGSFWANEAVDIDSCRGTRTFGEQAPAASMQQQAPAAVAPRAEPEPAAGQPEPAAPAPTVAPAPSEPEAAPQTAAMTAEPRPEAAAPACAPGTVLRDGACEPEEGGGCLVATAAYGTELAPRVQELRELRDGALLSTGAGASFMAGFSHVYYAVSPQIADLERQNPALRELVGAALTPGILILGYTMSPVHDSPTDGAVLAYGAASIAALAGFYAGLPALGAGAASSALKRRAARNA